MHSKRKTRLPANARQSIKELRKFYRLVKKVPRDPNDLDHAIAKAAEQLGVNQDKVRNSRALTDPEVGYSDQEFEELIAQLEAHEYCGEKWAFGITHLIRLLSVGKQNGDRLRIQEEVIEGEWNCVKLDSIISERYGTRRKAGRRRQVPKEREPLLAQIQLECDSWERWWKSLTGVGGGQMPLQQLPDPMQKQILEIVKLIRELRISAAGYQKR